MLGLGVESEGSTSELKARIMVTSVRPLVGASIAAVLGSVRLRRLAPVLVCGLTVLLLAGCTVAAPSGTSASFVLYGWGGLDPARGGDIQAIELPSGRLLGQVGMGGQGGGLAFTNDGRRAYLLGLGGNGWELRELEAPSLRVLRQVAIDEGTGLLGLHRVVVVATSGEQVYVETIRIVGPNRWDPRLQRGQPDSEYGIAVFDVTRGVVTGEIRLEPPWCGFGELYALPDGRLAVFCPTAREVRLIDIAQGKQVAKVSVGGVGGLASPDGQRFWVVAEDARLIEINLSTAEVTRTSDLSAGDWQGLPHQELHLSRDGRRLFVRAAPHDPELRATGNGSVVWVIDTDTLRRIADIPLFPPAFHLAPTPDGQFFIAVTNNVKDRSLYGTRLIEVSTGRQVGSWAGTVAGPRVVSSVRR